MKRFVSLLILVLLLAPFGLSSQPTKMIKTKVPTRPAGQADVLQLTAPPMSAERSSA
ncbi:MAG: hypothetical protein K5882_11480 [Bacteroidales bacterium]|nr:hypothetical protein [Bacteroidales bacterium]